MPMSFISIFQTTCVGMSSFPKRMQSRLWLRNVQEEILKNKIFKGRAALIFYSFIGPVGHNIWWENCSNGSCEPKNCFVIYFHNQT